MTRRQTNRILADVSRTNNLLSGKRSIRTPRSKYDNNVCTDWNYERKLDKALLSLNDYSLSDKTKKKYTFLVKKMDTEELIEYLEKIKDIPNRAGLVYYLNTRFKDYI